MKQREFIKIVLEKHKEIFSEKDATIIIAYIIAIMQVSEVLIELEILEK